MRQSTYLIGQVVYVIVIQFETKKCFGCVFRVRGCVGVGRDFMLYCIYCTLLYETETETACTAFP